MGSSQRVKGAAGEREVCKLLREAMGVDAKRNLTQTREGGYDIAVGPFRLEVKRRAKIGNVYEWMNQAEASCSAGNLPVVVCRADGKGWLAVIPFEDWMRLAREEVAAQ